jgi:hypothetical protein
VDPADFEAMAAEQNHCKEKQCLRGGSSLKLAFRQADAQRLVGNVSTRVLCPIIPAKFRKDMFFHWFKAMRLAMKGIQKPATGNQRKLAEGKITTARAEIP